MNFNNILIKNEYLISVATLFYIILVFLNFTHNSFDPYKKITLNSSHENQIYIKLDNYDLKKDISNKLASDEYYKNILNRDCKITGHTHDRHKVRWIKAILLKNLFQKSFKENNNFPYYIHILLHSIIIFFSLYFLNKTFSLDKKYTYLFLLYVTFLFQQHLGEYSYSIFEMFFLSLSLYASKNKKHFLFVLACILATLNRESGFIILFSWLIFNKDLKKFLIFSLSVFTLFIIANYDIWECLINPKFFVPLERIEGHVNFTDLRNMNLFSASKVIILNYILPFGIGAYFYLSSKVKNNYLLLLFVIYLLAFLFAAPIHQPSTRLILLPLIYCSIYFYRYKKI